MFFRLYNLLAALYMSYSQQINTLDFAFCLCNRRKRKQLNLLIIKQIA